MCGAFEQHGVAMHEWAALLSEWPANDASRINIRPTDMAGTLDATGYALRRWSLIPHWSKYPKLKFATFNARAESLTEKPSFRDAWHQSQRCIIPVSAYFEWPVVDGNKQCHRLARQDGGAILLGGLWENWTQGELALNTFTIITTAAASDVAWVHSRTPLLIDPAYIDQWLRGSPEEAGKLLRSREKSSLLATGVASPKDSSK
ncbi:SOS response-associated peptidase [Zhongshania guokunii]|uniref:Abasic site processing protein n=1 Tax=Zhongshania guokunii TaxID=641783 RepID=A0ABV3U6Q1_9GAMM